ncbi:hypothetical protein DB88DRAFT_473330 [Papiliotrema laurentii]|uniref:Uncharacterized protein n=1 Tax=Papiliotrema laurentii TaxID=5418 RepID=A0AAD9CZX3_PAPLA|nr:hypothetical protein DB88DRAFT_473330 [Papiliotrema laurentii]
MNTHLSTKPSEDQPEGPQLIPGVTLAERVNSALREKGRFTKWLFDSQGKAISLGDRGTIQQGLAKLVTASDQSLRWKADRLHADLHGEGATDARYSDLLHRVTQAIILTTFDEASTMLTLNRLCQELLSRIASSDQHSATVVLPQDVGTLMAESRRRILRKLMTTSKSSPEWRNSQLPSSQLFTPNLATTNMSSWLDLTEGRGPSSWPDKLSLGWKVGLMGRKRWLWGKGGERLPFDEGREMGSFFYLEEDIDVGYQKSAEEADEGPRVEEVEEVVDGKEEVDETDDD